MFLSLDISTSGLVAQRTRLDAISSNIANADVIVDPKSPTAFSERVVEFAQGDPASGNPNGVHVASITPRKAFRSVFSPNDPKADADGMIWYPAIDPMVQQANAMLASRAYDANLAAIDASKAMFDASLRIIA
jgi:flagellar basal-body rod protein FlgC